MIFQFRPNTNVRDQKNYESSAENKCSGHIRRSPNIQHIHRTFGTFSEHAAHTLTVWHIEPFKLMLERVGVGKILGLCSIFELMFGI